MFPIPHDVAACRRAIDAMWALERADGDVAHDDSVWLACGPSPWMAQLHSHIIDNVVMAALNTCAMTRDKSRDEVAGLVRGHLIAPLSMPGFMRIGLIADVILAYASARMEEP